MAVVYDPATCRYVYSLRVRYSGEALAILFFPPDDKTLLSVIFFDVYHKTRITPAIVNILMNYSHSGGLRIFGLRP